MIIWINGAFGSGKTQTSSELFRRIPNSFIYDPENTGYFIRKNIPKPIHKGDFQDFVMWRQFNYSMLKTIHDEFSGTIIVPMTIVSPEYFSEIVDRLREDGITVNHFTLCASKNTLLKRLRSRGEGKNSWAARQIDRCIAGLSHEVFQDHLDTDEMSIEDIVEQIAALTNSTLLPDRRSRLRKMIDRFITKLKG
ncbi:AAA family ATPase [Paenibacillus glacialis]|uniref:AAA family ATPase n=1 Tax=Paenibacillus glacialis TaxID=494026 RepID=UPI000AE30F5A|nr:AAA family ATPase [Paenibacillus glacialis]